MSDYCACIHIVITNYLACANQARDVYIDYIVDLYWNNQYVILININIKLFTYVK